MAFLLRSSLLIYFVSKSGYIYCSLSIGQLNHEVRYSNQMNKLFLLLPSQIYTMHCVIGMEVLKHPTCSFIHFGNFCTYSSCIPNHSGLYSQWVTRGVAIVS